ncbi:MAG: hypothetical protein D6731_15735 [Planctomycetota bacterium]|nr:MAG: hypothetical protein D6731_15735 [Planctomycetota bacterium]
MGGTQTSINWAPYKAPFVGQFFENPQEAAMRRHMIEGAQSLSAYRPVQYQARMNALQQAMSLFNPVNNALGQMYGPGAMMNMGQAAQSPLDPRAFEIGQPRPWKDQSKEERRGQYWGYALGTSMTGDPLIGGGIGQGIGGWAGKQKHKDKNGG